MAAQEHTTSIQFIFPFTDVEIWNPVVGYEEMYEVSNFGRVRSLERLVSHGYAGTVQRHAKIIQSRGKPYANVTLSRENITKTFSVHSLVLCAFVGPRPDGFVANHVDGNKRNNVLSNLEWVTQSRNHYHAFEQGLSSRGEQHHYAKLTAEQVREIRALYAQGIKSPTLARLFGVWPGHIRNIVQRKIWKHID
jgi:hypothetical protein